jgi:hypothetical protein
MVEEHEAHLIDWASKRDEFRTVEAILLGLHESLGAFGRGLEEATQGAGIPVLQQLEKLRPPWHHVDAGHVECGPREISAAATRWSAVLHRLKSDPSASL